MNYQYISQSDERFVPFLGPLILGGIGGWAIGASRPRPYPIPYPIPSSPMPYSYYGGYTPY